MLDKDGQYQVTWLLFNVNYQTVQLYRSNIWQFTVLQNKFDSPQVKQGLISNILIFVKKTVIKLASRLRSFRNLVYIRNISELRRKEERCKIFPLKLGLWMKIVKNLKTTAEYYVKNELLKCTDIEIFLPSSEKLNFVQF